MEDAQYSVSSEATAGEELRDIPARNGQSLRSKPSVVSAPVRLTVGKTHSLKQVIALQNAAHSAGEILSKDMISAGDRKERAAIATALARVCSSWTVLQDAKREIRGKGRVKPVEAKQPKQPKIKFHIEELPDLPAA